MNNLSNLVEHSFKRKLGALKDNEKFIEYVCPHCGKIFLMTNMKNYEWKYENKILCSYTCMRYYEKKSEEKLKKHIEEDFQKYYGSNFKLF